MRRSHRVTDAGIIIAFFLLVNIIIAGSAIAGNEGALIWLIISLPVLIGAWLKCTYRGHS